MNRLKMFIIGYFMHLRVYAWALKSIVPFIRFSMYYLELSGKAFFEAYRGLKPGHIILTEDRKKLTSLLIPGIMSHAALCVGRIDLGDEYEVAEMTHKDFTKSQFFDVAKECDRLVILECTDWFSDKPFLSQVVASAKSMTCAKYDELFTLGVEALYCSELIYQADLAAARSFGVKPRLRCDLSDLLGLGQEYISPEGLLFSKNVICVFDSDREWTNMIGPHIELKVMQKKSRRGINDINTFV